MPKPKPDKECSTCHHYKETEFHYNYCIRYPRAIAKRPDEKCGEYKKEK
ncbi:MAG: hypothetical protein KAS39_06595 [Actinomycetia bacterium]|nr:hypothetical protein [Actinomycetes bacterium]